MRSNGRSFPPDPHSAFKVERVVLNALANQARLDIRGAVELAR